MLSLVQGKNWGWRLQHPLRGSNNIGIHHRPLGVILKMHSRRVLKHCRPGNRFLEVPWVMVMDDSTPKGGAEAVAPILNMTQFFA